MAKNTEVGREQPQGEATPRPEDVATSPSEQCTFHYPLPIQFKDHLEVLQCILKREHSGQHRAATGETWRGSWEGQAQAEGGEFRELPATNEKAQLRPSSPPATAGTAREFVVEWAKRHKETYLQVDDIAACAESYAEQLRQADAWKEVAEERKKLADSLLDEVAQLRQERDALNTIADKRMKDLERAENCFDEEAKARERSERALREATRDGKWIYCTVKRHDALAELAEALAHVKSSESTKG